MPFAFLDVFRLCWASYIDDSEFVANLDVNVFCVVKWWQYERGWTRYEEIDTADLIAFKVDMLILEE